MSHWHPFSSAPLGPESVLSTRSLSVASNMGASPISPQHRPQSRNPSISMSRPTRRSPGLTDYSEDEDLVMEDSRTEQSDVAGLNNIPELPASVAHSLLFELPREIRDRIYSFCLTSRDGLPVEWPAWWRALGMQPQLLRTCKIIHDEATPILYSQNAMTFHHPSDANMFVRAIASPIDTRHIAHVSLHIKSQDTRLWMPFLTSADESRSLKADYPNLRELCVRFRSNKWQHQHSPATNLKHWADDSRLDEVIDGLRNVFLPSHHAEPAHLSSHEYGDSRTLSVLTGNDVIFPGEGSDRAIRAATAEYPKASVDSGAIRASAPCIRVCCACRVHAAHFNALTNPYAAENQAANGGTHAELAVPSIPVREGDVFHGFSPIDLQSGVKELQDPDLGSANVARTPYAHKNGILIALEIHTLDPKNTDRIA